MCVHARPLLVSPVHTMKLFTGACANLLLADELAEMLHVRPFLNKMPPSVAQWWILFIHGYNSIPRTIVRVESNEQRVKPAAYIGKTAINHQQVDTHRLTPSISSNLGLFHPGWGQAEQSSTSSPSVVPCTPVGSWPCPACLHCFRCLHWRIVRKRTLYLSSSR